ncbi:MAG: sporulation protein YqfD, partial [Eubacterium sp.]|nr:sporulation protein YqfD [Eubacterium sp.]
VKGYQLKIGKNRYKEISEQRLCLFGNYYLPVSMKCYRIYKEKPLERFLSKEEAEKKLHHKMLYYFAQLEQKGYKILKKDVKIEKVASKYWMKGKYTCIEPVGKVQYILYKTEKKEGKTDERN